MSEVSPRRRLFERLAIASWLIPLVGWIALVLSLCLMPHGIGFILALAGSASIMSGAVISLVSLVAVAVYGRKGLLAHALTGLCMIIALALAQVRVEQRREANARKLKEQSEQKIQELQKEQQVQ